MANNGRGKSPGSRKALEENRAKTQFRGESAVRGANRSNEAQREYKTLKQLAKEMFDEDRKAVWLAAMAEKADSGDAKAFEILRDTMGEKPSDSVEINGASSFQFELKVVE